MAWYWFILIAIAIYYLGYTQGKNEKNNRNKKDYKHSTINTDDYDYHQNPPNPEFWIEYCDAEGEITKRNITPLWDMPNTAFRAWCHLRADERTFRNERILRCIQLNTKIEIIDLKGYLGWYEAEDEY